jgi:hypothetical protein
MLTITTTRITSAVEPKRPPEGTCVDIIGGTYKGHIGHVSRYTNKRVVLKMYPALGGPAAKKTINKEVTIKQDNIRARKNSFDTDESPSNQSKRSSTHDDFLSDPQLTLLAGLVALPIKFSSECNKSVKENFLLLVKELIEASDLE